MYLIKNSALEVIGDRLKLWIGSGSFVVTVRIMLYIWIQGKDSVLQNL